MTEPANEQWADLTGHVVLLDLSSPFVIVGTLVSHVGAFLVLHDADVHDLRDTTTTRELYVQNCRRLGHTRNRRSVWVRLDEVVSLSKLSDVASE